MTNSKNLEPLPPISRRNYMKFTIGKDEPEEFDIIHITSAQILIYEPNFFLYRKLGELRIFESDVNWIPSYDELKRMNEGGLVPFPKFGVNSSRIETSYRFCFRTIVYGNSQYHKSFPSELNRFRFADIALRPDNYYLVLDDFGKYNWD